MDFFLNDFVNLRLDYLLVADRVVSSSLFFLVCKKNEALFHKHYALHLREESESEYCCIP